MKRNYPKRNANGEIRGLQVYDIPSTKEDFINVLRIVGEIIVPDDLKYLKECVAFGTTNLYDQPKHNVHMLTCSDSFRCSSLFRISYQELIEEYDTPNTVTPREILGMDSNGKIAIGIKELQRLINTLKEYKESLEKAQEQTSKDLNTIINLQKRVAELEQTTFRLKTINQIDLSQL